MFKNGIIGILSFFITYIYSSSLIYPYLAPILYTACFNFTSFILNLISILNLMSIDMSEHFVYSSSGGPGKNFPGYNPNSGGYNSGGQGGGPGGGPGGNNNPYFYDPHQGSSSDRKITGDSNIADIEQRGENSSSNYLTRNSSDSGSSISSTYTNDSTSFEPLGTHHNFNLRANEIEEVCIDMLKRRAKNFSKDITSTDLGLKAGEKYNNYILDWASIYLKRNPNGALKDVANNMMNSNRGSVVVYSANENSIGRKVIESMISTKQVSDHSFKPNTYNELAEYFSYKLKDKDPDIYTVNQLLHEGTSADKAAFDKFKEFVLLHPEYKHSFVRAKGAKGIGDYVFNIKTNRATYLKSDILQALVNQ